MVASAGVNGLGTQAQSIGALQALTAFDLLELSVFAEFSSLGSFGSPFSVGAASPPIVIIYNQSANTQGGGNLLKDLANNFVSIGNAVDQSGNTVVTASLNTSNGGIVGFQSAPPSGLNLTSVPPANFPLGALPSLTDSSGKHVPANLLYDQFGGSVLQIQLTDANGHITNFYSQVDSGGNAVDATTQSNQNTQFRDLSGVNVTTTSMLDQFGNAITVASLTNSVGQVVQYETQSPSVASLTVTLSTTNPVGPQNAQPGPFDNQGNQIANLTFYTAAGNTVDNITLYNGFGAPVNFFSTTDSGGNATQPITLTAIAAPAAARLAAFGSNPSLVAASTPTLPSSITPFSSASPAVVARSQNQSTSINLFSMLGLSFNPYSILSLFLPNASFSFLI